MDFSMDPVDGKIPPLVLGGETHANAICTRPISKEVKKRREKQEIIQKSFHPPLTQLPNSSCNNHHSHGLYLGTGLC